MCLDGFAFTVVTDFLGTSCIIVLILDGNSDHVTITECPRTKDPLNIVIHCIKWGNTSWTNSISGKII